MTDNDHDDEGELFFDFLKAIGGVLIFLVFVAVLGGIVWWLVLNTIVWGLL